MRDETTKGAGADPRPQVHGGNASRRAVVGLLAATAAAGLVPAGARAASGSLALAPPDNPEVVRLSSVVTPQDGGLYDLLLPGFTRESGFRIALMTGDAVYEAARAGQ